MSRASMMPTRWLTHSLMSYLVPSLNSVKPKPAMSGTITRHWSAKAGMVFDQLVQPETPGPEPCSRNRASPSPASW
ncbi:hypothetical protein D3C86_1997580 [compost metagenome]